MTLTWQIDEADGTTYWTLTATQAGYLAFGFGKGGMGSATDPSYVYIGGKDAASAAAAPFKITGFSAAAVVAVKPADFPMTVTGVKFEQTATTASIALVFKTADIAGYNTMYALGSSNAWAKHTHANSAVFDYRHAPPTPGRDDGRAGADTGGEPPLVEGHPHFKGHRRIDFRGGGAEAHVQG